MEGEGCLQNKQPPHQAMHVPECPVCWDIFDDTTRMPRILHCGHTVCESCLEFLPVDFSLGHPCLRCPECRSPCLWKGVHELPKNYTLLRALSGLTQASAVDCPCSLTVSFMSRYCLPAARLLSLSRSMCVNPGWFYRTMRRKLWGAIWLSCLATLLLVLFVSLSLVHILLGWWVVALGFFFVGWFLVGGFGLSLFLFGLWCYYNITSLVSRFSRTLHGKTTTVAP